MHQSIDEGRTAQIDAPGSENADTTVNIHYQTGCVFEIAKIDSKTGEATINEASIADIKSRFGTG